MTISKATRLGSTVLREGEKAPMVVIHQVAETLSQRGEVCVCFDHDQKWAEPIETRIEKIRVSVDGLCDVMHTEHDIVDPESERQRVFVLFRTEAVVHFTDAPWHPANCKGGKEHHRLVKMVEKGKPFMAVYEFDDQPNHREDGPGTLMRVLSNVVDGASLSVIRRDWLYEMCSGKCRIDIRIVPKESVNDRQSATNIGKSELRLIRAWGGDGQEIGVDQAIKSFHDGRVMNCLFAGAPDDGGAIDHGVAAAQLAQWLSVNGATVVPESVYVSESSFRDINTPRRLRLVFRKKNEVETPEWTNLSPWGGGIRLMMCGGEVIANEAEVERVLTQYWSRRLGHAIFQVSKEDAAEAASSEHDGSIEKLVTWWFREHGVAHPSISVKVRGRHMDPSGVGYLIPVSFIHLK